VEYAAESGPSLFRSGTGVACFSSGTMDPRRLLNLIALCRDKVTNCIAHKLFWF